MQAPNNRPPCLIYKPFRATGTNNDVVVWFASGRSGSSNEVANVRAPWSYFIKQRLCLKRGIFRTFRTALFMVTDRRIQCGRRRCNNVVLRADIFAWWNWGCLREYAGQVCLTSDMDENIHLWVILKLLKLLGEPFNAFFGTESVTKIKK